MTQVDFYILKGDASDERLRFACRLTDKAYDLGHRVFIHTASADQTRVLDELLWTFQQGSFIPHCSCRDAGDEPPPVLLAHDVEPDASHQVLINLANDVPLFFSRFERVVEVVDEDAEIRRAGRNRYGFYRDRGYPLRTHEIRS